METIGFKAGVRPIMLKRGVKIWGVLNESEQMEVQVETAMQEIV